MDKIKLGIALGATCAGCDVAILDLHEKITELFDLVEFKYWPTAMDFKLQDLIALQDGELDVGIFHGAIRTEEDKNIAKILRKKAKIVIAFGSCANFGGIPSLANIPYPDSTFDVVYKDAPSMDNPDGVTPQEKTKVGDITLTLPKMLNHAGPLDEVIDVDYYLPGCPPMATLIEKFAVVLKMYAETGQLPPKGTVFAEEKTLCDECGRTKPDHISIKNFISPPEKDKIDPDLCLLAQGILCMGPATRAGCGAICTKKNIGCRGCLGPPANVKDQGLKMLSAITSMIALDEEEEMLNEDLQKLVEKIKDPLGTFYRFTLGKSLIGKLHPDPDPDPDPKRGEKNE